LEEAELRKQEEEFKRKEDELKKKEKVNYSTIRSGSTIIYQSF
jgi:hypothetical protein